MGSLKLTDAPGCIGSVLIRKEGHPICQSCRFVNTCGRLASRNEERLLKSLGLEKISRDTGKKLMKGAEKLSIAELESVKYRDKKPLTKEGERLMKQIGQSGSADQFNTTLKLTSRVHVEHGLQFIEPEWARELIMLIWDNKGRVTKKDLREYLQHDKGFKVMTAGVYVAQFINATTNMGICKEDPKHVRFIHHE